MSFKKFKEKLLGVEPKVVLLDENESSTEVQTLEDIAVEEIHTVETFSEDEFPVEEDHMKKYLNMTKQELDDHAMNEHGIKLDRRKNRESMIQDLLSELDNNNNKEGI